MDKRVKEMWVKALRSGEYEQTQERLCNKNGYCCLGVLCDLHAKETGQAWDSYPEGYEYVGESGVLPDVVAVWAGLGDEDWMKEDSNDPKVNGVCLSKRNDDGMGFAEIADLIERHL